MSCRPSSGTKRPGKDGRGLRPAGRGYDALMIYEAQDLDTTRIDTLTCLLSDPGSSPVWLFMDATRMLTAHAWRSRMGTSHTSCRSPVATAGDPPRVMRSTGVRSNRRSGARGPRARAHQYRRPGLTRGERARVALWRGGDPDAGRSGALLARHDRLADLHDGPPGRDPLTDKRPAPSGEGLLLLDPRFHGTRVVGGGAV